MSTSYFAHAAYGVMLSDEHDAELQKLAETFEASMSEEEQAQWQTLPPSERKDLFIDWVEEDGFLGRLRYLAYAPPEATLIFTGHQDDRPGRCHTEPDCWLLGAGLMDFPNEMSFSKEIGERASWHTWVEAS